MRIFKWHQNTKQQKSALHFVFEGYSYRFDKLVSANTKKRWRCRTRDCNGCVYGANIQEIQIFKRECLTVSITSQIQMLAIFKL